MTVGATGEPEAPLRAPQQGEKARSLGRDAWNELRRRPMFWISAVLIVIFVVMAAVPQLFTSTDPYSADLSKAREAPSPDAWFGRDSQGYDVYARTVYGARASIMVGILSTLFVALLGSFVGMIAGYRSGWVDSVLSRIGEVFLGIPLLLGGILFLYVFPSDPLTTPFIVQVAKVAFVLGILGWPLIMRLMRSSVLQVKPNDYVQAARALGASPSRIIRSHVVPNAIASVIVVSTINLGVFISVEATLSYLGIGLQPPAISWGIQISEASGLGLIRAAPHMLFFPSLFLCLTVLAFIMLGDVVRDALDPKLR
ncbi:MAG TPA: ABC transporter permease [Microlunatus sp.]|nr:ABC transporter permease [Microlunatus sp.]